MVTTMPNQTEEADTHSPNITAYRSSNIEHLQEEGGDQIDMEATPIIQRQEPTIEESESILLVFVDDDGNIKHNKGTDHSQRMLELSDIL